MNVLVVEPGYAPYEKEINGLHDMNAVVGGTITATYPFPGNIAVVSNDDSISMGMDFNRTMPNGHGGIFGPFFVCGIDGEGFCSLSSDQMEQFRKHFHTAEILIGARGNQPVTLKVEPKQRRSPDVPQKPPKRPER